MKVLVIQNCEIEGFGLYERYLVDHRIDYDVLGAYKSNPFPPLEEYDAFFIGGTPISVNKIHKHDFLIKESKYIEEVIESNKPCLGICFGAQLLAHLLGAAVRKNPVAEIGGYEVKLTPQGEKDPCFVGFPTVFPVLHWHADTFDVPGQARLLVEGEDCRNQAFRFQNILGLQFHLEVTLKLLERWLEEYADELKLVNKTRDQIIHEYRTREKKMASLAYMLLDNFFKATGVESLQC